MVGVPGWDTVVAGPEVEAGALVAATVGAVVDAVAGALVGGTAVGEAGDEAHAAASNMAVPPAAAWRKRRRPSSFSKARAIELSI